MFVHFSEPFEVSPSGHKYRVLMHESAWERIDRPGTPASREYMMIKGIVQFYFFFVQSCRDFTAGDRCESCQPGYVKDRYGSGCVPESGVDPGTCQCDPRGTLSDTCASSGECECRVNSEGRNCDRCRPGTFLLHEFHEAGCLQCYCSGVTQECSKAVLYWSTQFIFAGSFFRLSN